MSETGFELRWGTGFDAANAHRREAVRSKLNNAFEFAAEGLDRLDVQNDENILVRISLASEKDFYASATGYRTINYFVSEAHLRNRRPTTEIITQAILHESVHCARWRTAIPTRSPERAVSEGLAYVSEYQHRVWSQRKYGGTPPKRSSVEAIKSMPKQQRTEMRKKFLDDVLGYASDDKASWDWWFMWRVGSVGLSKGEVVGVDAVLDRLRQGAKIGEMLTWTTAEVLGVA